MGITVHRVWYVRPTGRLFPAARDALQQAGFTVTAFPDAAPPTDRPLILLADLSAAAERVIETLNRLPLPAHQDDVRLYLVDAPALAYLPNLIARGLCAAWLEHSPPAQLVDDLRRLLERYTAIRHAHRLQAMIPLYDLAQSFADVDDLDTLLQRVLNTAITETGADRGSIMLLAEEGDYLYIAAAIGLPDDIVREQRQRVGEGIAGWVARHRQPLVLTEGEIPPFALPWLRGRNAYSSVSLPMIHQNQVLGVLNLTKAPGRPPFVAGDVEFIGILAALGATVIHNARLFMRLQRAYRDLQRLDRLRTQIIDIAAHELRTPVTVIKGYFALLRDLNLPEIAAYLAPMERHLERLETLARDLFDLSTLRRLERRPRPRDVDLAAWLEQEAPRYHNLAQEKGIHVDIHLGADTARLDPDYLSAILRHLVSNAIKFTPEQGRVAVDISRQPHGLVVTVDDSGPGIPEPERERVFDAFYQVEDVSTRTHEGLGVGLSLVRALARAHGGTVKITNSPLGGARIIVTLPQDA